MTRKCPICAAEVTASSQGCWQCGSTLATLDTPADAGTMQVTWASSTPPQSPPPPGRRALIISGAGLLILVVVLLLIIAPWSGDRRDPASVSASSSSSATSPSTASSDVSPSSQTSPSGSELPSTPPVDPEAEQARVIDRLLDRSASARRGVQPALNHIQTCRSTQGDVRALQRAADIRQQLRQTLSKQSVDGLSGGPHLSALLDRLSSQSARADGYYLAWRRASAGCFGSAYHDRNWEKAGALSTAATHNKQKFVEAWNPIAARHGLPTRSASEI